MILWFLMAYLNVATMVTDILGVILLICVSNSIEIHSNDFVKRFFEKIAYASMFAYLFHREFYQVAKRFFHLVDGSIPCYGIVITIIFIFVLSYYGQMFYGLIVSRVNKK